MTKIFFEDGSSQSVDHTTNWQHMKSWTYVQTPDGETYTKAEFDAKSRELLVASAQLGWDLVRGNAWEDALDQVSEDHHELTLIQELLTEDGVEPAPEGSCYRTFAQVELLRQQVRCRKNHNPTLIHLLYPIVWLIVLVCFVVYVWSHTSHLVGMTLATIMFVCMHVGVHVERNASDLSP